MELNQRCNDEVMNRLKKKNSTQIRDGLRRSKYLTQAALLT